MKRALLKDHYTDINQYIDSVYGNGIVKDIFNSIFDEYMFYEDIELIFPDIDDLPDLITNWLAKRTAMYKPYIDNFYRAGNFKSPEHTDRVVNREVNTTGKSASELQPINADINEITSPTSKGKTITNGDETRTEKSPEFYMELLKYQSESEPLYRLVRKAYLPILELYDKIY